MKNKHLAIGIAGSIIAGTIIGMLFAPDKGSNTRKKLSRRSDDLKSTVKDEIEGLVSSIEKKYENLTSKAENAMADKKLEKSKM